MRIIKLLQQRFESNPYQVTLLLAFVLRMIAVIFSRGFGMHDDHFLVIEPAQAWSDGINYQGWLPGGRVNVQPDGHSLLYSGLHFLLFSLFNAIHLTDPQLKMLIVRLIHALISLSVVSLGFKITNRISGIQAAKVVGLLLAAFWFMPMLAVRNLVEIFCIPFMMWGVWILIRKDKSEMKAKHYLFAGLVLGIAFSIRFQTAVFIGGVGIALLFQKNWKGMVYVALGTLASVLPVQGLIDYFVWKIPFAEFAEYVRYNIQAANDYITGPWYNYILLLAGILIPPVSLLLLAGFFRLWKKQLLIFLPAFLFLAFHSFFPNKQERFIFPIIPFVLILGIAGWNLIVADSVFWKKRTGLLKGSWIFFWVINSILLIFITVSYSKKSRVEVMSYLNRYPGIEVLLLEDSNHESAKMVPQFYMGQWAQVLSKTTEGFSWYLPDPDADTSQITKTGFVCFFEDANLDKRVSELKSELPELEYEATFKPGFIDELMFRMNPVNLNQTIILYRNKALFPSKITN